MTKPKLQMKSELQNPNAQESEMAGEFQNTSGKDDYDLEERTARFGEEIIEFAKTLPRGPINDVLIGQIVRSGTSVGANYVEADCAESKKDFRHKIAICRKESKETKHWLRMIAKANENKRKRCRELWQEAQELVLIFSSILLSSQKSKKT